jgi:hypothetical protein
VAYFVFFQGILIMPRAKPVLKPAPTKKASSATTKSGTKVKVSEQADVVFLNVALNSRVRAGLNKLVDVMDVRSQRLVLEQLITDELRRRNLRLPRAA